MKVCVVLTSRGNYAKFKRFIELAEKDRDVDVSVITGGELVLKDRVVGRFNVEPNISAHFTISGDTNVSMAKSVGAAVSELTTCFDYLKPDIVCVVGDRFETLGVVTSAYMMGIPVAHLEGGELSGGLDEGTRHAITKLSHLHFPCTQKAGGIIRQLGENPENIHVAGSTSLDSLIDNKVISLDFDAMQNVTGSGDYVDTSKPFILVVQHPVTTENDNYDTQEQIWETIYAVRDLRIPSVWLNANLDTGTNVIGAALRQFHSALHARNVRFFKSLPIEYFGYLLKRAACVVGNSSAGVRECSFLGTPSVNIGHRQINREVGCNTISVEHDAKEIEQAVLKQIRHGRYQKSTLYGDGTASEKILNVLKNYKAERQKVFYETMGDRSCESGECGCPEQKHTRTWG